MPVSTTEWFEKRLNFSRFIEEIFITLFTNGVYPDPDESSKQIANLKSILILSNYDCLSTGISETFVQNCRLSHPFVRSIITF